MKLHRIAVAVAIGLALIGPASAQGHRAGPPGWRFDERYQHDHYYPQRGQVVPVLPGGAVGVAWSGGQWYFHAGVWFRPHGGRFIVELPPLGIVVPVLPRAVVTLSIGGGTYYYANGVYYGVAPGGYAVVPPPAGAETAQPAPPPAAKAPDPIIYPRNGQSPQQTEADRQECDRWATTQPKAMADASVFQRAVAACMDGRGYTVR